VSGAGAPAGFWKRYVAYFIDAVLVGFASYVVLAIGVSFLEAGPASTPARLLPLLQSALAGGEITDEAWTLLERLARELLALSALSTAAYAVVMVPYAIVFEAGPRHATPGKRLMGLRVAARGGGAPTRAQAAWRVLAAGLSWLTFNLGHALAAWTRDKRALHDLLAGTEVVVVDDAHARMPAWGWVVIGVNALAALGVALLGALAGALVAMNQGWAY
jgi:uncharacterized RDD family membrane protein YckC